MKLIFAIDPGCRQSAYVVWDGVKIQQMHLLPNEELRSHLKAWVTTWTPDKIVAIERMQCFGRPVGEEVFETCYMIGRLMEIVVPTGYERYCTDQVQLVSRIDVKNWHCHSSLARDPHIRQAMIDKYGKPGTKKKPGLITYGIHGDLWSAFAIATYVVESRHWTVPRMEQGPRPCQMVAAASTPTCPALGECQ